MAKKKTDEQEVQAETPAEETSIVDQVVETVADAASVVADAVTSGAAAIADVVTGGSDETGRKKYGKRAEKIGVVASDKMTKTVVVRVDRLVKHPIYRKYVRKRKKFMAHDETGAKIGDKVRIVETRPMSARKRWRVVEIIQKAEL
jgi:small subunit ribosomal protein S17